MLQEVVFGTDIHHFGCMLNRVQLLAGPAFNLKSQQTHVVSHMNGYLLRSGNMLN